MKKEEITEIVVAQLQELNDTFPENQKIEVSDSTVLFGEGSVIDSLSLVSFIVDLESAFADRGHDILLTDDRAMTREVSPFINVNTLVDYIDELINQN